MRYCEVEEEHDGCSRFDDHSVGCCDCDVSDEGRRVFLVRPKRGSWVVLSNRNL